MNKLLVIPRLNELGSFIELKNKYNLGFEYNDFFVPQLLDNKEKLEKTIKIYEGIDGYKTLHGVFLDICFNSSDSLIKDVSYKRARQTLDIATKLGCKKIIFHTNYIVGFNAPFYINGWIKENAKAYKTFLKEYPNIEILVENMFDDDYVMIKELIKEVNDSRFRMCLDVAHANLSKRTIKEWFDVCKGLISHVHLNDNDGDFDSHKAIGDGKIDYDYVISMINKLDVTVLIEVNNYDNTYKSINYLIKKGVELC